MGYSWVRINHCIVFKVESVSRIRVKTERLNKKMGRVEVFEKCE